MPQNIGFHEWLFYLSIPVYTVLIWGIGYAAGWLTSRDRSGDSNDMHILEWRERSYAAPAHHERRPRRDEHHHPNDMIMFSSDYDDEEGGRGPYARNSGGMKARAPLHANVYGGSRR